MKALKDKDVKEELFLTDIVRSKRPYKDDRGRGVIINTYVSRTANNVDISGEIKIRYLGREFQITRIGIDFLNDGGELKIGAEPVERS